MPIPDYEDWHSIHLQMLKFILYPIMSQMLVYMAQIPNYKKPLEELVLTSVKFLFYSSQPYRSLFVWRGTNE